MFTHLFLDKGLSKGGLGRVGGGGVGGLKFWNNSQIIPYFFILRASLNFHIQHQWIGHCLMENLAQCHIKDLDMSTTGLLLLGTLASCGLDLSSF